MQNNDSKKLQQFLDKQQYSKKGILCYEKIFGATYVSTGGEKTTALFCTDLNLKPGQHVLDIGCGIGGSAFYMAKKFGTYVHGVDLSTNMIQIANDYRCQMPAAIKHRVQFHVEDAMKMEYPERFYDVVYTRDTILHIDDKQSLFKKILKSLKPGGKLFITDYCRGDRNHDEDFKIYVKQRNYHLLTVKEYGKLLEKAGFDDVIALDNTKYFIDILEHELKEFKKKRDEVIQEYSQEDFDKICDGWSDKLHRCGKTKDQAWGYFLAKKNFSS